MHELSLCEDLLAQVHNIARQHKALSVASVTVRIGPLSGVEPLLLETAFEMCRAGTLAGDAKLILEPTPVRIQCESCGTEHEVPANHLLCPACQSQETQCISGDELILARVELDTPD